MIRWRRSEREAFEAAADVFGAAGWTCREEIGGKHKLAVATLPDGTEFHLPLCGSPAGGVGSAVKLARWNATKAIRRYRSVAA